MGLTLLTQASMPLQYWWEAFNTSIFLINHLSTPTLNHKSPIDVLLHIKPNLHFLKVFGCACFPHLRDYNQHKLDFRSIKCVFIGYSPNHKGYQCLHPSGKVYIARSVTFNEDEFPFALGFPNSTTKVNKFQSPTSNIQHCHWLPFLSNTLQVTTHDPSADDTSPSLLQSGASSSSHHTSSASPI